MAETILPDPYRPLYFPSHLNGAVWGDGRVILACGRTLLSKELNSFHTPGALDRIMSESPCLHRTVSPMLLFHVKDYLRSRAVGVHANATLIKAWEEFFELCDPLIRRMAVSCGLRGDQVDDCAQEVWCIVLAQFPTCDSETGEFDFFSWLFIRVRNTAVDSVREKARRLDTAVGGHDAVLIELPCRQPLPAQQVERRWNKLVWQKALTKLKHLESSENYDAFVMRRILRHPVSDIANKLEIHEDAVRCGPYENIAQI